jgi:hypothetical protein
MRTGSPPSMGAQTKDSRPPVLSTKYRRTPSGKGGLVHQARPECVSCLVPTTLGAGGYNTNQLRENAVAMLKIALKIKRFFLAQTGEVISWLYLRL